MIKVSDYTSCEANSSKSILSITFVLDGDCICSVTLYNIALSN